MFLNLIKLNFKLIFRSAVFWICSVIFIFAFGLTVFMYDYLEFVNYSLILSQSGYIIIILFILCFISAVYFSHNKTVLEQSCLTPVHIVYKSKFAAVLISFMTFCIIPVCFFLVLEIIEKNGILFFSLTILYMVIYLIGIISVATTLGFLTGYIVRPFYAYIFSIPFAVIFSILFQNTIFKIFGYYKDISFRIYHMITMNSFFGEGVEVEYRGPNLNILFLIKFLMTMVVALLLCFILFQVLRGKVRTFSAVGTVFCVAAYIGLAAAFWKYHPVRYNDLEKLYILDYKQQPYEITSYSGDINLKEWSDYSISVGIKKTGEADGLTLRLDQSMKIKSLDIDGKDVDYKRFGDILEIDCNKEEFTLNLSCGGRISYVNELHSVNIYTTNTSCALPPEFAFLPKIDGDKSKKQYDLSVKSNNTLISNLDFNKENGVYKLSGNSQNMCLFSGFLTQTEIDGITFYHASCSRKLQKSFEAYYSRMNSNSISVFNPDTYDLEKYSGDEKSKVFMIYYLYGNNNFFVVYDDYMMYNYGYPI